MKNHEQQNKAKKQTKKVIHQQDQPEVYKTKNKTGGIILNISSFMVILFSIMTMILAVYTITPFLIIVGIPAELSNAAVLYTAIREMYGRTQYSENQDFNHLPKIGQSGINYFPILVATYLFWFGLVGYCAYTSAEKRTRANTEGSKTELTTANEKLNTVQFYLSFQEKKRENAIDSLRKSLSLCNKQIEPLVNEYSRRDEWVRNQYFYPKFRPLDRERGSLEKSLKDEKARTFTTEIETKTTLEKRITELRTQIQTTEKESNTDKYFDFCTHIVLMLVSAGAVGYATYLKVRFDLFCGVGLDTECECEQTVKEPSKTKILEGALKDLRIERSGEHGKIETAVTLSTFLNWKANKKYEHFYKESLKQLGRKYIISESQGGNKRLPKLIKK